MVFSNKKTSLALASVLFGVALVLSFPAFMGLSKPFEIQPAQADGYLFTSKAENSVPKIRGRALVPPEIPRVLENGVPLPIPNASEKHIRNGGFGRYAIKGREIYFSTSDGMPPQNRRYEIVWPLWSLPEGILLLPWFMASGFLLFALRGRAAPSSHWLLGIKIAAAGLFFLVCVIRPNQTAASFFNGLTVPVLWAGLVAAWASRRGSLACAVTCLLCLLPVWAAAFVYLIEARSQGSFLVAGIIPRSDAWLHFVQAIQVASSGGTDVFFNGRLIYPAFLSSLLALTGLNLAVSMYLSATLVLLACGIAARFVAWRAGWFAAACLCLIVWVYFRNDGCGAAMTENFGLLAGLLAIPFFIKGFHSGRVSVFAFGVFLIGIGFSARPGALFLLPALGFATGFLSWQQHRSCYRAFAAIVLAGVFGLAGLVSNGILTSTLLRTEGVAFGNFAYSLHGLLHGTDWEDSYSKYQGDTKRIMQINRERLRDDPASLARGIARAYGETFGRRFLFRFGRESRLAALGMLGFCIAGVAVWFLPRWRSEAPWISASFLGILASIPFAPPWDASVRPYAVSIPLQAFLAGAGWIMLYQLAQVLLTKNHGESARDARSFSAPTLHLPTCLAAVVLFLAFVGPFLLRTELSPASGGELTFLPGASVTVVEDSSQLAGSVSEPTFRRGLAELAASYPESLQQFANMPRGFRFGITTPDMEVALVPLSNSQKKAAE